MLCSFHKHNTPQRKQDTVITFTALVDEVDDEVGQVRLVGHKGLPVAVVQGILQYTLAQDKGFRRVESLALEGYEFEPSGPHWNPSPVPEEECWTWDFNRATV